MALGFWEVARERPDDRALVDAFRELSWAQLDERCNRLANALGTLGLGRGDHVALLMGNRAEFLEAYGAIFKTGRYLTGINWHYKPHEVAYVLKDCDARVFVIGEEYADTGLEAAAEAHVEHVFVTGPQYEDLLASSGSEQPSHQEAGVWMPYTGGTTGRPKGVFRPLRGMSPDEAIALASWAAPLLGLDEGGVHLVTGPMYHNAPMGFSMGTIHLGQTQVLMPRWDAEETLRLIERHRVTTVHMVPTMFRRLLDLPPATRERYDLSSLRTVVHGAAPCPKWVKRAMIDWLGGFGGEASEASGPPERTGPVLVEYYGSTEGGLTVVRSEEWLERPGTVGRAVPVWDVIVRDPDGEPLPVGKAGLVWFKLNLPDIATFSYYKDEPETRKAYAADGTFTAGDIGYVDADGYLFLVDRAKELIISGGVNIYPVEVEEVLSEHPDVLDVAVFGIPNDEWGEEVKAAVVLRERASANAADIIEWSRERMAHYKVPRSIDVCDSLPRDETGKLFRRKLREPYWEGRESAISAEPIS